MINRILTLLCGPDIVHSKDDLKVAEGGEKSNKEILNNFPTCLLSPRDARLRYALVMTINYMRLHKDEEGLDYAIEQDPLLHALVEEGTVKMPRAKARWKALVQYVRRPRNLLARTLWERQSRSVIKVNFRRAA